MNMVSTFGDRILELRKQKEISLAEMSKIIKDKMNIAISAQALNRYELGQREAKITVGKIVAEAFNVNPLWICGYDAEMYITKIDRNIKDFPINLDEKSLIECYRRCNEEEKKKLLEIAEIIPPKNISSEKQNSIA